MKTVRKLFHKNLSFSPISKFQLSPYFLNYSLFYVEKL